MTNYKEFRDVSRQAAVYWAMICFFAAMSDADLALLELDGDIRSNIAKARSSDDFLGIAAAYAGSMLSNSDMTEQDRLVVGQALAIAGSRTLSGGVATKTVYDEANITENQTVWGNFLDWIGTTPKVTRLYGDAWWENVESIVKYTEQYNRDIKDATIKYTNSKETNETEGPDDTPLWMDILPFVGRQ